MWEDLNPSEAKQYLSEGETLGEDKSEDWVDIENFEKEEVADYTPPILQGTSLEKEHKLVRESLRKAGDEGFDTAVGLDLGHVKWALEAFKGVPSEDAARLQQIALYSGVPFKQLVNDKEVWIGRDKERKLFEQLLETKQGEDGRHYYKYPTVVKFLSNPNTAVTVKDGVEHFLRLEKAVAEFKDQWFSYGTLNTAATMFEDFRLALGSIPEIIWGVPNKPFYDPQVAEQKLYYPGSGINIGQETIGATRMPLEFDNKFKQYMSESLSISPQIAGTIGMTLLAGPIGGASFMGTYIYGDTYRRLRQQGISQKRAASVSAFNAVGQGLLEGVALSQWVRFFKTPGMKNVMTNFLRTVMVEMGQEWAQEYVDVFATTLGEAEKTDKSFNQVVDDYIQSLPETTRQGMHAAFLMLPWALMGGTAKFPFDLVREKTLERDLDFHNTLEEIAQEIKTPETAEEFIGEVIAENNVPDKIHVPVGKIREFYQDDVDNYRKTVKDLGIEDQVESAINDDTEVDILRSTWLSKFAGSELSNFLRNDMRFDLLNGMTLNERKDMKEDLDNAMALLEQDLAAVEGKEEIPQGILDVKQFFMNPVEEGGMGMSAEDATHNTALVYVRAKRIAESEGLSVKEAFEKYPVLLETEKAPTQAELEEALFQTFEVSSSPMVGQEIIDNLREIDPVKAEKLTRVNTLATQGHYQQVFDETFDDIDGIFGDYSIPINNKLAEGRYLAEKEPSYHIVVDTEDTIALHAAVAETLKEYPQQMGIISELVGAEAPKGFDPNQAPSEVIVFSRALSEKEREQVHGILNAHGIDGSKYIFEDEVLEIHHLPDFVSREEFEKSIIKANTALSGMLESGIIKERREVWYKHTVLENDWSKDTRGETYDKIIEKGKSKKKAQKQDRGRLRQARDKNRHAHKHQGLVETKKKKSSRKLRVHFRTKPQRVKRPQGGTFYQIEPDPLGFYSKLKDVINDMNFKSMPSKDLANRLMKVEGIKKEELEYVGVIDWLNLEDRKVTKEDVLNFVTQGGVKIEELVYGGGGPTVGNVVYGVYHPDGEGVASFASPITAETYAYELNDYEGLDEDDYRYTVQDEEYDGQTLEDFDDTDYVSNTQYEDYTLPGGTDYREVALLYPKPLGESFTGAHFQGQHNILAFARIKTRKDKDGKSVLFIEEIQSDWHQTGRKDGYTGEGFTEKREALKERLNDAETKVQLLKMAFRKLEHELVDNYIPDNLTLDDFSEVDDSVEGITSYEALLIGRLDAGIRVVKAGRKYVVSSGAEDLGTFTSKKSLNENLTALARGVALRHTRLIANRVASNEDKARYDDLVKRHIEAQDARDDIAHELRAIDHGIPDAPFKQTDAWAMLIFKRLLRMAQEEGHDKIAWTTGKTQSERYSLEKHLSSLSFMKGVEGKYLVHAKDRGLKEIELSQAPTSLKEVQARTVLGERGVWYEATEDQLSDIFGKDITKKIVEKAEEGFEDKLVEEDLKISNKGMASFYDVLLKKAVEKYVKKIDKGAKVESGEVDLGATEHSKIDPKYLTPEVLSTAARLAIEDNYGGVANHIIDWAKAMEEEGVTPHIHPDSVSASYIRVALGKEDLSEATVNITETAHTLNLTPKIKSKVLTGQTLFQSDKTPKGAVTFDGDRAIIKLFQTADQSTFIHEMGHVFVHDLRERINRGDKDPQAIKDYETLSQFVNFDWEREGQEKLARAFEQYIMEGKAPSVQLVGAFQRFRSWLMKIYKTFSSLDVKINNDVREVFDRMLASEAEIKETQEYYGAKRSLDKLMPLDEAQTKKVRKLKEQSTQTALDIRVRKVLSMLPGKKVMREHAAREIEEKPLYKALSHIEDLGGIDGADLDANALHSIDSIHGKKYATDPGKGVSLASVAEKFEFKDPETLLREIVTADNKRDAVTKRTDELMAQQEQRVRDELTNESLAPADEALHNPVRLAELVVELEILGEALDKKEKAADDRRTKKFETKIFVDAVKDRIKNMKMSRATQYHNFAKSEQKYANAVERALMKDDLVEAHEAKKQQLIMHLFVQESIKARDFKKKIQKKYQKSNISKRVSKIEDEYKEVALSYMNTFGLTDFTPQRPDSIPELYDIDPALARLMPLWVYERTVPEGATKWTDLKYQDLIDLDSAIDAVISYGRDDFKSMEDEANKSIDAFVEDIVEHTNALPDKAIHDEFSKTGSLLKLGDALMSRINMAQFLFERLDGYQYTKLKTFGPLRRLFNRGTKAETDYSDIKQSVYDRAKQSWEVLFNATKRIEKMYNGKSFQIEGVPMTPEMQREGRFGWTVERMIAFALNMGNAGNIQALMNSYGYNEGQIAVVLGHFTKLELQAIQGIWDVTNVLYPDLDRVHFNMYNRHLDKVEAQPLTVQALDGQITLPGGYYPLVFDHSISDRAAQFQERKSLKEQDVLHNRQNTVYRKTKPEDGMTYSRTPGHSLPPDLRLSVWFQHMADVARYISHAEYLRDINKVTLKPEFRSAILKKAGRPAYNAIRDWVQYLAVPERKVIDPWERVIDKQRRLATIAILGMNIPVGIKQRLSTFAAIKEIGWMALIDGVSSMGAKSTLLGLKTSEKWQEIMKMSPYIRSRTKFIDRDIQDTINRMSPMVKNFEIAGSRFSWKDVQDFAFEWIQMNDRATVGIVWTGAFNKFLKDNMANSEMSEQEKIRDAVVKADNIVQMTQPSALPVDLNTLQRSEGMLRLFTAFMTWTFKHGNRMAWYYRSWQDGAITTREYVRHFIYDNILPSMGVAAINGLFYSGDWPEWYDWFFSLAGTLVDWIPFIREIQGAIQYKEDSAVGKSPAFEGINRAVRAGTSVWYATEGGEREMERALWDVGKAIEYQLGFPALKFVQSVNRSYEKITD